jgi:hypothetical protein
MSDDTEETQEPTEEGLDALSEDEETDDAEAEFDRWLEENDLADKPNPADELEELRKQHGTRIAEAEASLKTAIERVEALRGRDGDLRPSEQTELFESAGKIAGLQAVVDTLEFRAEFVGMADEELAALEEERFEIKQAARAALRELEEAGKHEMVEGDRRVLERRRKAAFAAHLESLGQFGNVGQEIDYRKADVARGHAERLASERRQAAEGKPQPAFPVGDDGTATLSSPGPSKARPEPMVKRDVPLSQSEGGK